VHCLKCVLLCASGCCVSPVRCAPSSWVRSSPTSLHLPPACSGTRGPLTGAPLYSTARAPGGWSPPGTGWLNSMEAWTGRKWLLLRTKLWLCMHAGCGFSQCVAYACKGCARYMTVHGSSLYRVLLGYACAHVCVITRRVAQSGKGCC
jgi:hypothetical protein